MSWLEDEGINKLFPHWLGWNAVPNSTAWLLVSLFPSHPCSHCSLVRLTVLPWTGAAHPQPWTYEGTSYKLWRPLFAQMPHLQSPCATNSRSFSGPNSDLSVHSSVGLQCCAWALAPSTAVRKLSSEREPGDHRAHLPSLLSLRDHRLLLSLLSWNHYLLYVPSCLWWKN